MAHQTKSERLVASAMREVHTHEPSTVARADVSEARKEKMRKAIALSKARKAGAHVPPPRNAPLFGAGRPAGGFPVPNRKTREELEERKTAFEERREAGLAKIAEQKEAMGERKEAAVATRHSSPPAPLPVIPTPRVPGSPTLSPPPPRAAERRARSEARKGRMFGRVERFKARRAAGLAKLSSLRPTNAPLFPGPEEGGKAQWEEPLPGPSDALTGSQPGLRNEEARQTQHDWPVIEPSLEQTLEAFPDKSVFSKGTDKHTRV